MGRRRRCTDEYVVMLINDESDRNIEELTDEEICAAIMYLEPHSDANEQTRDNGVLICVCLYIALLAGLAFVWFCRL